VRRCDGFVSNGLSNSSCSPDLLRIEAVEIRLKSYESTNQISSDSESSSFWLGKRSKWSSSIRIVDRCNFQRDVFGRIGWAECR